MSDKPQGYFFGKAKGPSAGAAHLRLSTLLASALKEQAVETVFTLAGGHSASLLNSMDEVGIRLIDARHEGAAAQMAQGWALTTGQPGVVVVTAGAGFTNAVTALADAWMGGIPLLMLGGRTALARQGRGAIQDIDQAAIAATVTKFSGSLAKEQMVALDQVVGAHSACRTAPAGPVYLDLPADILRSVVMDDLQLPVATPSARPEPDSTAVAAALDLLRSAERPLLLVGSGAHWSGAGPTLVRFAESTSIPTTTTSAARGLIPDSHPCSLGGLVHGGLAMQMADVVVVVGSRFNGNLLFGGAPLFSAEQRIIQIDVDPQARDFNRAAEVFLQGDALATLEILDQRCSGMFGRDWLAQARSAVAASQEMWAADVGSAVLEPGTMHPAAIGMAVDRCLGDRPATVVIDGGDVLAWNLAFVRAELPGSLLTTSTSLGTLGVGMPFACAASAAHRERKTVLITGDGSFGLSAMEIDTAVRHGLDITVLVANNGCWGDVRNEQQLWFGPGREVACLLDGSRYDLLATSLGARGLRVNQPEDLDRTLAQALEARGVTVIDVKTDWRPQSQMLQAIAQTGIM